MVQRIMEVHKVLIKKIKYFCVALPNGEVKFTQKKKNSYLIEQPGRKDNLSCIVEYKETPEIKGRPVLHVAWPDHLYQQNITHAHEEGWPWWVHEEPAIDPWVCRGKRSSLSYLWNLLIINYFHPSP